MERRTLPVEKLAGRLARFLNFRCSHKFEDCKAGQFLNLRICDIRKGFVLKSGFRLSQARLGACTGLEYCEKAITVSTLREPRHFQLLSGIFGGKMETKEVDKLQ